MDNNFVLPETEKSLNLIISKIKRSFDISFLCFSGLYAAYTVFRIIFMKEYFVLNIILCAVAWGIFIINALEFFKKIRFNHTLHFVFSILKRVICIFIFIISFINLFSSSDKILPYKILFTMFCGVGLIISVIGDIFSATIPVWTQTILTSFKSDIELSGLAERSFDHLKVEIKKDGIKGKRASGVIQAGNSLAQNMIKKFFKGKDES